MIDSDSEEYEDTTSEEISSEEIETPEFQFSDEELRGKKVRELRDLVVQMTERKGGTYSFPLGRKGYRTKGQIINLIQIQIQRLYFLVL